MAKNPTTSAVIDDGPIGNAGPFAIGGEGENALEPSVPRGSAPPNYPGIVAGIHEKAVVEQGAHVGKDTTIWAFSWVMRTACIGDRCVLGQGVHVGPEAVIGDGCSIQNGAQIFAFVTLCDDVFIGPHVVFTNVLTPRAFVNRKTEFKRTHVGPGSSIGANATIVCGIKIGECAMVGAGSVVTKDVEPHQLVYGNPATHRGWVCTCGVVLGDLYLAKKTCSGCETKWRRTLTGIEHVA